MASIKVQVQVLKGPTFDLQLASTESLADLRHLIYRETLVPPSAQRLILNNAKVLPEDGILAELGFAETSNVKMIASGSLQPEFANPPKPAESEIGRLFQLGWNLIRTNEGRGKLDKMIKAPSTMRQEIESEPLAAGMMSNPVFAEMATSKAFLSSMYYACTGEEMKDQSESDIVPPPMRIPLPPRRSHEESLQILLDMGYSQGAAEAALAAANDDFDQALTVLLN